MYFMYYKANDENAVYLFIYSNGLCPIKVLGISIITRWI